VRWFGSVWYLPNAHLHRFHLFTWAIRPSSLMALPPIPPNTSPNAAMGVEGEPNRPESALIPTSPRSVEACFRLGLDPLDLAYRPLAAFKRPGEPPELTQKRHAHHEQLRQVREVGLCAGPFVKCSHNCSRLLNDSGQNPCSLPLFN